MITVINNNLHTEKQLLGNITKYIDGAGDTQFEDDWKNAISGDELVRRVHCHIDELYNEAEK